MLQCDEKYRVWYEKISSYLLLVFAHWLLLIWNEKVVWQQRKKNLIEGETIHICTVFTLI